MAKHEQLENDCAKLTICIEPEVFARAVEAAFRKTGKRYNIPGFRKGHAPRKVIENMYGAGVLIKCWAEYYNVTSSHSGLRGKLPTPRIVVPCGVSAEGTTDRN